MNKTNIQFNPIQPDDSFITFDETDVEQSIAQRFEQIVARHADRPALRTPTHSLSYRALNNAANHVAHTVLDRCGSGAAPVALLFENGAPFVIASIGVLKTGKIQVPMESTFPASRLEYMRAQSGVEAIVTDTAHLPMAAQLGVKTIINIDELDLAAPAADPDLHLPPDTLAAIGYTSGSTGQPKGITWNQRGVLHAVMRHTNTTCLSPRDRLVMFRASLRSHLYALLTGAAYYPVDLNRMDVITLERWLQQERITVYRGAVSVFRAFTTNLSWDQRFPALRLIALFGEPVYRKDVDTYRNYFSRQCVLASTLGCNEFDDYAYSFVTKDTPPGGTVGDAYPVCGTQVWLLNEAGAPLREGNVGELAIRSRYNAVGYWERPDLTSSAFLADPAGGDARIYRTGDIGRVSEDGAIRHLGRADFQVKIRGHRVEVVEVEEALLQYSGVQQAAVSGYQAAPGDTRLAAYLVVGDDYDVQVSALRRHLAEKLPDYMLPAHYMVLDALPLTATGKIDRRSLPPPGQSRPDIDEAFVPPANATEASIAEIWMAVLGLERVGRHDKFLELGGESLSALRVVAAISEKLGVAVPLGELIDASTVAEMADVIAGCLARATGTSAVDPEIVVNVK